MHYHPWFEGKAPASCYFGTGIRHGNGLGESGNDERGKQLV